jgi:hypothetical protein
MSCPSALIGHPEGSANGFPLKDCGNDREDLSFFKRLDSCSICSIASTCALSFTSSEKILQPKIGREQKM